MRVTPAQARPSAMVRSAAPSPRKGIGKKSSLFSLDAPVPRSIERDRWIDWWFAFQFERRMIQFATNGRKKGEKGKGSRAIGSRESRPEYLKRAAQRSVSTLST